LEIGRPEETH